MNTFDFSAERVKRSVEESMQRLGVTHLDLVQCHDIEYGNLDQIATETIPALLKLKSEGKIRAIGITGYPLEIFPYVLSCVPRGSVDVVLSYCNYCMLNDRLSLLLPALKREGVSVINASPLCMGLLTPGGGPAWHPADKETKAVVRRAEELCRQRGKDLASIALQWALQADPGLVVNTLVGIDSVETLEKNLDVIGSPPDKDLMGDILAVLKPVRNRTWDSGRFQGNSNLTA